MNNDSSHDTEPPRKSVLRSHRELVIILAVSALLRILLLVELAGGPCWRQYEWRDCDMNFFHRGASEIAAGDILLDKPLHPYHNWHAKFGTPEEWQKWYGHKRYYQDPGYYYLAAIFHAVFSDGPSAIKVFQLLAGLATILLTYLTALHLFGRKAAVIAAALLALCGPLYFYDVLLLRATFLTFATALFAFVATEAFRKDSLRWWLAAGAVLGLFFLLKSTALLLLLVTLAVMLVFGRREPRKTMVAAGAVLGVFILVLVPLFVRNAAVGAPVLSFSSVGSATFILGNGPESSGDGLVIPDEMGQIMRKTDGAFWPVVRETYATHDSFTSVVGLWFAKAYYFFRSFETPNNASFYAFRQSSWILSLAFVGFYLLTPLMAIGAYLAFRKHAGPQVWLLTGIVASLLVPTMFFFFVSRYRLPAAVPFAILGGCGVTFALENLKKKHYGAIAILAASALAVGVLFNAWGPRFPGVRSSDYGAQAVFHFNRRNYPAAAQVLQKGMRHYPDDVALNRYLALSYMALGRDEEAITRLDVVLKGDPQDARSRLARANLLYHLARYADAASDLEVLHTLHPDPKMAARLVECHVRAGDLDHARNLLREYPEIRPHLPPHILHEIE